MKKVRIVATREEDIPTYCAAVGAVARECRYIAFVDEPPVEMARGFVRGILSGRGVQMLAVSEDEVVGWCDIVRSPFEGVRHVGTLGMGLLAAYRGQGLGKRLTWQTLRAAHAAGIERVELEVFASNAPAIALYERIGFVTESVKRRARKLDGQYDDNMIWRCLPRRTWGSLRSRNRVGINHRESTTETQGAVPLCLCG